MTRNVIEQLSRAPNKGARIALLGCLAAVALAGMPSGLAQGVFDSGSTGADGALEFFSPPTGTVNHAMVYDPNRQVVVLFGGDVSGMSNQMWEWNGTTWTRISPANAPTARQGHAMAYDTTRGVIVLFGGRDASNTYLNDTWEYDGANWSPISVPLLPGTRWNHGLAYDEARGEIVMTCGANQAGRHNDTWVYDGTAWTQKAPATQLPQMDGHAMAYDAARQRVVVFFDLITREWDGENWTAVVTSDIPPADFGFGVAYDPTIQRIVLYGGWDTAVGRRGEMYYYDGANWVLVTQGSPAPGVLQDPAMAYDAARGQLVLFGGYSASSVRSNRTWLFTGDQWHEPTQVRTSAVIPMGDRADGIWNYTTVTIPAGTTLTFSPNQANTPVVWLCSGDVTINGAVHLDGQAGGGSVNPGNERRGGPGGFAGGLGGQRFDISESNAGTPGQGPGGGLPGLHFTQSRDGGHAGHATAGAAPRGGKAYGNRMANPLIGGSGGGGGSSSDTGDGANGGGGGGAILIASSGNITINGTLTARGGASTSSVSISGEGSGGTIRLVANRIQGPGVVNANNRGRIRTEAFFVQLTGQVTPPNASGPPIVVQLENQGDIRIANVAGQVVPLNPSGNTNSPDVIFTQAGQITISLETTNVPQGTVITVRITAAGEVIEVETSPVAANGTATAQATVPAGVGTIQAYADYVFP